MQYFFTRLCTICVGRPRSTGVAISARMLFKVTELLLCSCPVVVASAEEGVKPIRILDTRSVSPGPEGIVADTIACTSPLAMMLSLIPSPPARRTFPPPPSVDDMLKSGWAISLPAGTRPPAGMFMRISEALRASRWPVWASSVSRRAISDSRCCTILRGMSVALNWELKPLQGVLADSHCEHDGSDRSHCSDKHMLANCSRREAGIVDSKAVGATHRRGSDRP